MHTVGAFLKSHSVDKDQYQIVKEAMDQHAERCVVLFSDWAFNKGYYRDDRAVWYKPSGDGVSMNTEDLFQQFKQEICNRNGKCI